MESTPDTLVLRQLELLHKAAFGCMDTRMALTEENDPAKAHELVCATITVLEGVRDSLEIQHDLERVEFGGE